MRLIAVAAALGAVLLGAVSGRSQGPEPAFLATDVTPWRAVGADGASRMNLVGRANASPTELVAYRERYPAGFMCDSARIGVHRHLGTQHLLVLAGTLVLGYGDAIDYPKAKRYGPQSFVEIPSGAPHFEWSPGALEIQVTSVGRPRVAPIRLPNGSVDGPSPTTFVAARCAQTGQEPPPASPNGLAEWQKSATGSRMVLAGDPLSPTELHTFRVAFSPPGPDRDHPIYHYHWGTEHATISRGALWIGFGSPANLEKAKRYGPGSFVEIPAGTPHYEWFEGELEVHVEFVGPSTAVNLDRNTGLPE